MSYNQTDSNQKEIIEALVTAGASVFDASQVGSGFPDLVVGFRGKNYLIEVKSKNGKLNSKQIKFFEMWRGSVYMVKTAEQALEVIYGN